MTAIPSAVFVPMDSDPDDNTNYFSLDGLIVLALGRVEGDADRPWLWSVISGPSNRGQLLTNGAETTMALAKSKGESAAVVALSDELRNQRAKGSVVTKSVKRSK